MYFCSYGIASEKRMNTYFKYNLRDVFFITYSKIQFKRVFNKIALLTKDFHYHINRNKYNFYTKQTFYVPNNLIFLPTPEIQ